MLLTGRLTSRCDVYSFGVVLLELVTGRRAVEKSRVGEEHNLVDWAKPYLGDKRKVFRIMDTNLQGQYPQKSASMVAALALKCINEAKLRPPMSEVLSTLESLPPPRDANSPSTPETPHSPYQKSPMRSNFASPVNISPRSPLPSHMKSPLMKSPRGR